MTPPNKYSNCRFCNCVFLPVDAWKHDVCEDFYRFTIKEMIMKHEKELEGLKKLQQKMN